mmetsp:Transcript_15992/g.19589  ORF Transcript_15992/g.19589 Transcript_15992/m.19589 type:complete len:139 (+) Transcript_15992:25-441(+)
MSKRNFNEFTSGLSAEEQQILENIRCNKKRRIHGNTCLNSKIISYNQAINILQNNCAGFYDADLKIWRTGILSYKFPQKNSIMIRCVDYIGGPLKRLNKNGINGKRFIIVKFPTKDMILDRNRFYLTDEQKEDIIYMI